MRGRHGSAVNQRQRIYLRPEEDEEAGHTQSLTSIDPHGCFTHFIAFYSSNHLFYIIYF